MILLYSAAGNNKFVIFYIDGWNVYKWGDKKQKDIICTRIDD